MVHKNISIMATSHVMFFIFFVLAASSLKSTQAVHHNQLLRLCSHSNTIHNLTLLSLPFIAKTYRDVLKWYITKKQRQKTSAWLFGLLKKQEDEHTTLMRKLLFKELLFKTVRKDRTKTSEERCAPFLDYCKFQSKVSKSSGRVEQSKITYENHVRDNHISEKMTATLITDACFAVPLVIFDGVLILMGQSCWGRHGNYQYKDL